MTDPKQPPDYDPEWEQERPIWEAYQRGEITDDDFIPLEEFIDSVPGLREEFDKVQKDRLARSSNAAMSSKRVIE